ncbi:alpha-tocopherol transfer protein-like [Amblyomma americanum]
MAFTPRRATAGPSRKWNTDVCSVTDLFRVGILHTFHLLHKEDSQVKGIVVVIDVTDLGPHHVLHFTPFVIKRFITLMQVHLFGHDVSRLHGLVPDDLVPEEYGGTLESYDYTEEEEQLACLEKWVKEFLRTP